MRRTSSTVVCVAGEPAVARRLGESANVAYVAGAPDVPDSPERVPSYGREVSALYDRAAGSPYTVLEADPLAPAREAWRRRFTGDPDTFDVIAGVVGDVELPDYYLLVHPAEPGLTLEWYGGFLRTARPSRVVVVVSDADAGTVVRRAAHALATLPTGPWWPPVPQLLRSAGTYVPAGV